MTAISALAKLEKDLNSIKEIAEYLNIHISHLYNYYSGYRPPSPTLINALITKGLYEPRKRIRSQITWKTREQKESFTQYIQSLGYRGISDYCRDTANSNMETYKSASRIHNRNK